MSFLTGRDGQISVIRVGTFVAIIGIFLVIAAVIAFYIDQASYQVPLDIAVYPGAETLSESQILGNSRHQVFVVRSSAPEDVVTHYQELMARDFAGSGESCRRYPNDVGNYPASEGRNDVVPYQFICLFSRSGFSSHHYTKVTIQPGLFDPNERVNQLGNTLIEYEQRWES